jgi:hypothetical protein
MDSAGAIYTRLVRPLLPQLFVDSVFVLLAADLAGFQPIKPLGAARDALYSKIERLLLPNVAESEESTRSDATGVETRGQRTSFHDYRMETLETLGCALVVIISYGIIAQVTNNVRVEARTISLEGLM